MSADLNTVWFILVGVLLAGYAVLDGFDLGVGALYLLVKGDDRRRVLLNAIGPVWDGNEVWLITAGGALFAAFPAVYAEVFSGFYLAFMLLLLALIARAVSIEFRGKRPSRRWRQLWDGAFAAGSIGAALLMGVALGNIAWGIPLDPDHRYTGGLLGLLRPYPLLVGVTTVALFAMHGALFLLLKTEGELQRQLRRWAMRASIAFILCYLALTAFTLLSAPHLTARLGEHVWLINIPLLNAALAANILRELRRGRFWRAFLCSSGAIVLLMLLLGVGLYPNMVLSVPGSEHSLTIYNAASSARTLKTMLIIAGLGMPAVVAYTVVIYRIFRGAVRIDSSSY